MLEVKTQTQHLLADVRNTNEIFNFMIENILASSSPRRKTLLNQIGFNFRIINSNVKEHHNLRFPPEAFAEYWAREKSKAVAKSHPNALVIGADTIITLNGEIYGKPVEKVFFRVSIFETNNKEDVFVIPSIFCGFIVMESA